MCTRLVLGLLLSVSMAAPAAAQGRVIVTVFHEGGNALLGNAEVCLGPVTNPTQFGPERTADSGLGEGRVIFRDVPAGNYRAIAHRDGFVGQSTSATFGADGGLVNITLTPGDPVSGVTCTNPVAPPIVVTIPLGIT